MAGKKQAALVQTHQSSLNQDTRPKEAGIMAKKPNTETRDKNQSESFDQELSELRESLDSDIKEMEKMDFAEFRSKVLDHLREIHEHLFIVAHRLIEEQERLDGCLDVIVDKTHERDELLAKAFERRDNQIEGIGALVFGLSCKSIDNPSGGRKKEILSIMGFNKTEPFFANP